MSHRNEAFQAMWQHFSQRQRTLDSLAEERQGRLRRLLPDVAFIVPVEDEAVIAQCKAWQDAFARHFQYVPQPLHFLHITLHYMGDLRQRFWQLGRAIWRRSVLHTLAAQIRPVIEQLPAFEVQIGPLAAFPSALIAEVHDPGAELDTLRATLKAALPPRAWPPSPFSGYLPHITLGYWGDQPIAPLAEAIRPFRDTEPLPLRVERVKFTTYARDQSPLRRDVLVTAREDVIAEFELRD